MTFKDPKTWFRLTASNECGFLNLTVVVYLSSDTLNVESSLQKPALEMQLTPLNYSTIFKLIFVVKSLLVVGTAIIIIVVIKKQYYENKDSNDQQPKMKKGPAELMPRTHRKTHNANSPLAY